MIKGPKTPITSTMRIQVVRSQKHYKLPHLSLHSPASPSLPPIHRLAVGAPRANSSYYNPDHITEPGVIYKCNLRSQECEELFIDEEGTQSSFHYLFLKTLQFYPPPGIDYPSALVYLIHFQLQQQRRGLKMIKSLHYSWPFFFSFLRKVRFISL